MLLETSRYLLSYAMAREVNSSFHLGLSPHPLDHTPCIFAALSPPRNWNRSSALALRDVEEGTRKGPRPIKT